jgi:putative ABC transport system substrate-binding protein
MTVYPFDILRPDDIEPVFAEIARERVNAVLIEAALFAYRARILPRLVRSRLPSIAGISPFAEEGALMAYGADWTLLFRRAGSYVDKILNGAKPGDLPIEQPTKFELVINLKTAKALGLTIPPSLLQRADEVIHP